MKHIPLLFMALATSFVLAACDRLTTDTTAPASSIIAQGFHIESVQEGAIGRFGSLRLRIESPGRIEKLQIKERSYHVDLATTPERAHFNLFGIERNVLLGKDVTLDLQNYINQKLEHAGEYTISIDVTDKLGQVTSADIPVQLHDPEAEAEPAQPEAEPAPVKTGHFEIKRTGAGEIKGEKDFGLTWKTIDEIHVTIRVMKKEAGATKLSRLNSNDYDNVLTGNNLNQLLESAQDQDHVEFSTANNVGTDKVLGVVNLGESYVIKTNQSMTAISSQGTTVTLKGEYKSAAMSLPVSHPMTSGENIF